MQNKQVLINSYMESFVKLQTRTSMKNVSGLKAMYDLVEENVRNLPSLGVASDTYGKLLVQLLIEKILHCLRLVISHGFDDKVWNLENMVKYFKKELFAKQRCASLVINLTNIMKIQCQQNYVVSIAKDNIF